MTKKKKWTKVENQVFVDKTKYILSALPFSPLGEFYGLAYNVERHA
jgi:hypothetical protein